MNRTWLWKLPTDRQDDDDETKSWARIVYVYCLHARVVSVRRRINKTTTADAISSLSGSGVIIAIPNSSLKRVQESSDMYKYGLTLQP